MYQGNMMDWIEPESKENLMKTDEMPVIDLAENRTAHNKTYTEPSLRKAIHAYARREGLTDSEAGRQLWLIAFCDKNVFGGYKTKGFPVREHKNESM